MSLEFTLQQQQELDLRTEQPPHIVDPRTQSDYVLIPVADFNRVREMLEEDRTRQAIARAAMRNAVARIDEET